MACFQRKSFTGSHGRKVPLHLRIRFLGIFSNNLDEFFRVRVAGLKRAMDFKEKVIAESFFNLLQKFFRKSMKLL
jgi:polyphosphate kinase